MIRGYLPSKHATAVGGTPAVAPASQEDRLARLESLMAHIFSEQQPPPPQQLIATSGGDLTTVVSATPPLSHAGWGTTAVAPPVSSAPPPASAWTAGGLAAAGAAALVAPRPSTPVGGTTSNFGFPLPPVTIMQPSPGSPPSLGEVGVDGLPSPPTPRVLQARYERLIAVLMAENHRLLRAAANVHIASRTAASAATVAAAKQEEREEGEGKEEAFWPSGPVTSASFVAVPIAKGGNGGARLRSHMGSMRRRLVDDGEVAAVEDGDDGEGTRKRSRPAGRRGQLKGEDVTDEEVDPLHGIEAPVEYTAFPARPLSKRRPHQPPDDQDDEREGHQAGGSQRRRPLDLTANTGAGRQPQYPTGAPSSPPPQLAVTAHTTSHRLFRDATERSRPRVEEYEAFMQNLLLLRHHDDDDDRDAGFRAVALPDRSAARSEAIYRAALTGTHQFTAAQVDSFLRSWKCARSEQYTREIEERPPRPDDGDDEATMRPLRALSHPHRQPPPTSSSRHHPNATANSSGSFSAKHNLTALEATAARQPPNSNNDNTTPKQPPPSTRREQALKQEAARVDVDDDEPVSRHLSQAASQRSESVSRVAGQSLFESRAGSLGAPSSVNTTAKYSRVPQSPQAIDPRPFQFSRTAQLKPAVAAADSRPPTAPAVGSSMQSSLPARPQPTAPPPPTTGTTHSRPAVFPSTGSAAARSTSAATTTVRRSPDPAHPLRGEDRPRVFVASNFAEREKAQLQQLVSAIGQGATMLDSPFDAPPPLGVTHIVVPDRPRSIKALCGLVAGLWVVPVLYMDRSRQLGFWVDENACPGVLRCRPMPFQGLTFSVEVDDPLVAEKLRIILAHGGGTMSAPEHSRRAGGGGRLSHSGLRSSSALVVRSGEDILQLCEPHFIV